MPTLTERIGTAISNTSLGRAILAPERERSRQMLETIYEAYVDGPYSTSPEELTRSLRELDPAMIDDLVQQAGWEVIAGAGYGDDLGAERERAIQDATRMFRYSPLMQWAIWLWTGWGLGDRVIVTPNDPRAEEVWTEFYTADRNAVILDADNVNELSDWTLVEGEQFLTFFASTLDGQATMRTVAREEIAQIITNPDDDRTPWFYKREFSTIGIATQRTLYYPDWLLFSMGPERLEAAWAKLTSAKQVAEDAERADKIKSPDLSDNTPGTAVVMMHIAHNRKDRHSLRGWPITTTGTPWLRSHKRFAESRLAVAVAVAAFVRRYKVSGGQRAVDVIRTRLQSTLSATNYVEGNPAPIGGSSELLNKSMEAEDLPLRTGASDAQADNELFSWMALLSMGIFPTSAGLDASRWATAIEMDKAQSMLFQKYQNFWATQFRRISSIVLMFAERYGNQSFADKSVKVSIDAFSLSDFPAMSTALGQTARDLLSPFSDSGVIDEQATRRILQASWTLIMQSLGITDPDLISDETWRIGEEYDEEPQTPESPTPHTEPAPEEVPTETIPAELRRVIAENVRSSPELAHDALALAILEAL